jgi:hypothetical protein
MLLLFRLANPIFVDQQKKKETTFYQNKNVNDL